MGLILGAALGGLELVDKRLGDLDEGVSVGIARAGDAGEFDVDVCVDKVLYPCRDYKLALAGLELLLDTPRDLEAALIVEFTAVTGLEEAVLGKTVGRHLGLLVVAEHAAGAVNEDFAFV